MTRKDANARLVEILAAHLASNPDTRFGQALRNLGFVDEIRDADGMPVCWANGFNEESVETLARSGRLPFLAARGGRSP